jgi:hypothetical protein
MDIPSAVSLATLAITILIPITVLAYKLPQIYLKIGPVLQVMLSIAWIGMACWDLGVRYTYSALTSYIPQDKLGEAERAVTSLGFSAVKVTLIFAPLFLYLSFLYSLPQFIPKTDDRPRR